MLIPSDSRTYTTPECFKLPVQQAKPIEHRAHLLALAPKIRAQRLAIEIHLGPEMPRQIGFPSIGLGRSRQHRLPKRNLFAMDTRRTTDAAPRSDHAIDALLDPCRSADIEPTHTHIR